jgi:hypothetical protein
MKTIILFLSLITATNAFAKSSKKSHRKEKPPVTIIDMSGPPEPESPLPEIAKKGSF